MTDEQKKLYIRLGGAAALLLLFGILVWLSLSNAGRVSYNTRVLADVRQIRAELAEYYYVNDAYPSGLSVLADDLSLVFPLDSYAYSVCEAGGDNCEDPALRQDYRLGYSLRPAADIAEGGYVATPESVMGRN